MTKMQLIEAIAHPGGNRIDMAWLNPRPDLYGGVRVTRGKFAYPDLPGEEYLADIDNPSPFIVAAHYGGQLDRGLVSPGLLASFLDNKQVLSTQAAVSVIEPGTRWQVSENNRVYVIIAGSGGDLEVYGRATFTDTDLHAQETYYYTLFPYEEEPGPAGERIYIYDSHNRVSAMATGPYDSAGQMARMLPPIYHRYDTALPKDPPATMTPGDMQKGQLRRFLDLPGAQLDHLYSMATAALDLQNTRRTGANLLPLSAQWIGWETDTTLGIPRQRNEIRNAPALYKTTGTVPNLEAAVVKIMGNWKMRTKEFIHHVFLSNSPEKLNLWQARQTDTGRWQEEAEVFSLDYAYGGRASAAHDKDGVLYLFYHTPRNRRWAIWYRTCGPDGQWTGSRPLGSGKKLAQHPSATLLDPTLWVYWNSYKSVQKTWQIEARKLHEGKWLEPTSDEKLPCTGQCKSPQALVDGQNRLWLFYLEKQGDEPWRLKYNRFDGTAWAAPQGIEVPTGPGQNRVEKDLLAVYYPTTDGPRIIVAWAQKNKDAYWELAYREKRGVTDLSGGWTNTRILPKDPTKNNGRYHDCGPSAAVDPNGDLVVAWATNGDGGWTVGTVALKDLQKNGLKNRKTLAVDHYTRRAPLLLQCHDQFTLVYRSNRPVFYNLDKDKVWNPGDFRGVGSISLEETHKKRNALSYQYDDFIAYTYDTGSKGERSHAHWYNRQTVAIEIRPDTYDQDLIFSNRTLMAKILARFLPINLRLVFIVAPTVEQGKVYTYDFPQDQPPRYVGEFYHGTLTQTSTEQYDVGGDNYIDTVPGWRLFHSWSNLADQFYSVNFKIAPIDTNMRTWHRLMGNTP